MCALRGAAGRRGPTGTRRISRPRDGQPGT